MTVFTDEQLDHLDSLEKNWRNSLPNYTLRELLTVYPGAEKAAIRGIKERIKEVKTQYDSLNDYRETFHNTVINKAKFKDQPELIRWLNERIDRYSIDYESQLKKLHFQLHLVDSFGKTEEAVVSNNGVTDLMVAKAKEVPISTMLKVNKAKNASCVWHNDKNPSMHVYNDHRVYCFPCAKAGDSIDVYMALNKCDFKTAVRAMVV